MPSVYEVDSEIVRESGGERPSIEENNEIVQWVAMITCTVFEPLGPSQPRDGKKNAFALALRRGWGTGTKFTCSFGRLAVETG